MVARGVDVVFGAVVVASIVAFLAAGRGTWFFADEWMLADQGRAPSGLVRPYNNHLSILILGLYRVLLELFGFGTYTPYRVAGVVAFSSVAVAAYVVFRREVGVWAAAVVGVLLLWPRGISLEPGSLNHPLAALGAVVCAYGLNGRGRRRDLLVAAGAAFALASAGGGIAVVAAAVVHSACSRASRSRWLAVAVPAAAWVVWYLVAVPPEDELVASLRPGPVEIVRLGVEHALGSFSSLTLGNRAGGVVVALVVLAVLVLRLSRGLAAAAGSLAWLAALAAWWLGLAWSRWVFLDTQTFRYDFVSMVLILLALLGPRRSPDAAPGAIDRWVDDRFDRGRVRSLVSHPATAPVLLVVVLAVVVPTVHTDLQRWSDQYRRFGEVGRQTAVMAGLGPAAVPDDEPQSLVLGGRTGAQLRTLMTVFRAPPGYGELRAHVDAMVSVSGAVEAPAACDEPGDATRPVAADGRVVVTAPDDGEAEVRVGRFDRRPVEVATVPAGRSVEVRMRSSGSAAPWRLRVEGGCLAVG